MSTSMAEAMRTQDIEELALKLLSSLPRSRLAALHRQITPLLQFDVVGTLPAEISLQIFLYLPYQTLLACSLVSKRWQALANDQALWKSLCKAHGWAWRQTPRVQPFSQPPPSNGGWDQSDDEGMGDSDEDSDDLYINNVEEAKAELTMMYQELDSGFISMSASSSSGAPMSSTTANFPHPISATRSRDSNRATYRSRHSAPSILSLAGPPSRKPDYKLLHQTHIRLRNRFLSSSYRLSALQTRGALSNAHTSTIYCLQLYTDHTGRQVLFTGSRDKSVREWNLSTGLVERVIDGVHSSSVLSICAHNGYLASAGSDRQVVLWDLRRNKVVKVICDHLDSVLCVRFNDQQLVSCSKDRTIRIYSFPDLQPQFVLNEHLAAVNAVCLSDSYIVSGSGDRSVRLWDAKTGKLLRTFDGHHARGIASIDFKPPVVLSGSSDKHLRLFDMTKLQGWSTAISEQVQTPSNVLPFPLVSASNPTTNAAHQAHGSGSTHNDTAERSVHTNLVRSVALGDDFVVSGSYDLTIKVWDRKTGALVADLTGGHTGRIFCIGFDCTKIVSCGEDQRICIWDFSHGIDTSFLQLS